MKAEILTGKHAGEVGTVAGDTGSGGVLVSLRVNGTIQKFTYNWDSLRQIREYPECPHQALCHRRWGVSAYFVCNWRKHADGMEDCGLRKQFKRNGGAVVDDRQPTTLREGDRIIAISGKHRGKAGRIVSVRDDYDPTRYLVALETNGRVQRFTYSAKAIRPLTEEEVQA